MTKASDPFIPTLHAFGDPESPGLLTLLVQTVCAAGGGALEVPDNRETDLRRVGAVTSGKSGVTGYHVLLNAHDSADASRQRDTRQDAGFGSRSLRTTAGSKTRLRAQAPVLQM